MEAMAVTVRTVPTEALVPETRPTKPVVMVAMAQKAVTEVKVAMPLPRISPC